MTAPTFQARPAPPESPTRTKPKSDWATGNRKGIESTIRRKEFRTHRSHGLASAVCQIWSKRGACSTWNAEKIGCFSNGMKQAASKRGQVQS
jgi:hypothetical protein